MTPGRPGGPRGYSAAGFRACRVIDAGRPGRGSAGNDHSQRNGRVGRHFGLCRSCTALRRHRPRGPGAKAPGGFLPAFAIKSGAPTAQARPRGHPGGKARAGRTHRCAPTELGERGVGARRPRNQPPVAGGAPSSVTASPCHLPPRGKASGDAYFNWKKRENPMDYEAGTYDIAVIGAGQGPREAGTRLWARTSVFASGENLAAGAIHLPRGCKITLGSRVARRIR